VHTLCLTRRPRQNEHGVCLRQRGQREHVDGCRSPLTESPCVDVYRTASPTLYSITTTFDDVMLVPAVLMVKVVVSFNGPAVGSMQFSFGRGVFTVPSGSSSNFLDAAPPISACWVGRSRWDRELADALHRERSRGT
jgi:hypothetical protein